MKDKTLLIRRLVEVDNAREELAQALQKIHAALDRMTNADALYSSLCESFRKVFGAVREKLRNLRKAGATERRIFGCKPTAFKKRFGIGFFNELKVDGRNQP